MGNNLTGTIGGKSIIGTLGSGHIVMGKNVIPDWNQNDPQAEDYIKNRPGGYDIPPTVDISWDGDLTGKEKVQIAEGTYMVKIANEAPSAEQFALNGDVSNLVAIAMVKNNRDMVEREFKLSGRQADETGAYLLECREYGSMVFGFPEDVTGYGMTSSRGLWVLAKERGEIS